MNRKTMHHIVVMNCNIYNNNLVGRLNPLKNMKVYWDDDIPNIWENKIDVPNHQPD